MKIAATKRDSSLKKDDTIAVMVTERKKPEDHLDLPKEAAFLETACDLSSFRARPGDTAYIPLKGHPGVVLGGLGRAEEITAETVRNCGSAIAAECLKRRIANIQAIPPSVSSLGAEEALTASAEGYILGDYAFTRYKSKKENGDTRIGRLIFRTSLKGASSLLRDVEIVGRNTNLCRDLVNDSSDSCTPASFAAEAQKLARTKGVTCTVFGEKEIARLRMGLLLAVSRGSANPPRLVVLRYRGDRKSSKSIALVGKGITFDSGGLNLKSSGNIEGMRSDMAGAAACLFAVLAAAELGLEKNITAVIPLAENMPGSRSYRPGDVYRAYNGKTVEIGNTDAEGRLVLADALAYTADKIKPDMIIDIATLTGACIISLGEIIAGYLTNDEKLSQMIFSAGERTGERLWRLPLYKEYDEDIKSDFADLNNVSAGRKAGAIIGAVFLKHFTGKVPWAHIDIAGTSWFTKKRGYRPKYATGYGVRLFIDLVRNLEF